MSKCTPLGRKLDWTLAIPRFPPSFHTVLMVQVGQLMEMEMESSYVKRSLRTGHDGEEAGLKWGCPGAVGVLGPQSA